MKRRRLWVMIAVHVLIAAHIVHWLLSDRTMGPVVLSDSMKTLELGTVNPGFLLFALALLVTLVMGRFLCGWGCHMGALQDLCAWSLERIGLRPRPFRSRILGIAPMAFAAYMFAWPVLKRDYLIPLLKGVWPAAAMALGPTPARRGWTMNLATDDLWAGLPGVMVAVPFLLVCGGATVLFLGRRGFCRYGCPYGGVFAPVANLSVARIAVDMSLCDGCGKCTAACGHDVRVHEEVRAFGVVRDARCARSLDCIEACPHQALRLGASIPPLFRPGPTEKPRRRYDVTLWEEATLVAVFVIVFAVTRGLYNLVPMFMAIGLAGCLSVMTWKASSVLRRRQAYLAGLTLRHEGRVRPAGALFLAACAAAWLLIAHSTVVRVCNWRGDRFEEAVGVTREAINSIGPSALTEEQAESAARASAWYDRGRSIRVGGFGLTDTPSAEVSGGWMRLAVGDDRGAEDRFINAMARDGEVDDLCIVVASLRLRRGEAGSAALYLEQVRAAHPRFAGVTSMLVSIMLRSGRAHEAVEVLRDAVEHNPGQVEVRVMLASVLAADQDAAGAAKVLEEARVRFPDQAAWLLAQQQRIAPATD